MKFLYIVLIVFLMAVTGCSAKKETPYASVEFTQVQLYQNCGEYSEPDYIPTVFGKTDLQNIEIIVSNLQLAKSSLFHNKQVIDCYRSQQKDVKKEKKP